MNEKVPQSLKDKQEIMRQNTINTVMRAITELQAQGFVIRIKELVEYTGFSRSTLSKPHVRQILVRYGVVEVKKTELEETIDKAPKSTEKRLRAELKRKEKRIVKMCAENTELKQECELLRGRLFLLMQSRS